MAISETKAKRPALPQIEPPPPNDVDRKDVAEAHAYGTGKDIEALKAHGDHKRGELIRNNFSWAVVGLVWIFGLIIIAMICSYIIHLILPEHYQYLSFDQVSKIESFLLSGSIGAFLMNYVKKAVTP